MRLRKKLYWVHRWLGLIIGVQLLAWSVGGLMFSLLDIDDVHGDFEKAEAPPRRIQLDDGSLSPGDALERASTEGITPDTVARITLRARLDGTVYELFDLKGTPLATVDPTTGRVTTRISEEEAKAFALDDFAPEGSVASIEFLEGDAPLEYRGKPMPVYRVTMDHPKEPNLYICPVTGEVRARRNQPWRLFDFFWMLHIMDYSKRESINHWLLTAASAFAVATSATGLCLWWWRRPRRAAA